MTVINDAVRFLVQRKLWPLVILLLVAGAAVPVLLSKAPAPAAPPVAAVKSKDSALVTEPIVAPAGDADRAGRRHVLGTPKDPFKPNATPTPSPSPTPDAASTPAVGGGGSSGGSTGGSTGTPTVPGLTAPTAPVTPEKTYADYELSVRFGPSDAQPARRDVKRLAALPSSDAPVLIYLGVLKDSRTAVFLLDAGTVAEGDGKCAPSRATCATIHLKEGETEFFDVPAEPAAAGQPSAASQYRLDVIKIRKA